MATMQFGGTEAGDCRLDQASIVVLPLCHEHQVSYGTGAAQGPCHILEASTQLEMLDDETFVNWSRLGIHTLPALTPSDDPETAVFQMKAAAKTVLDRNQFLLSIGGDHAISIGPVMAAVERYDNLGVLQIDAHLDLRDEWNGSRYNHACVMRRVMDDMGCAVVQVGIRSVSAEEYDYVKQKRLEPIYAGMISDSGNDWMDSVINRLPSHVYLTIDLDGLDPAVMPGVGTPEPGGMTYRQLMDLIRKLGQQKTVVAADINELCKIPGTNVSEYTAAKIATKLFVYASDTGKQTLKTVR
ncbi:MAG: agmatinase [Desulfatirhabdiaceae bacterium]